MKSINSDYTHCKLSDSCKAFLNKSAILIEAKICAAFLLLDDRGEIDRATANYLEAKEFSDHINKEHSNLLQEITDCTNDELRSIILHVNDDLRLNESQYTTGEGLSEIAVSLLNIERDDTVADLCCGYGSFMIAASKQHFKSFYGVDLSYNAAMIANIRACVLNLDAEIITSDVFSCNANFNKVFSDFPIGLKSIERQFDNGINLMKTTLPEGFKAHSIDWLFCLKIARSLKKHGKGIGVMTLGPLYNSKDEDMRLLMLKSGFIEAVIALPGGMLAGTNIPCALVVLSNGNHELKLVDASDLGEPYRRGRKFSENDISELKRRLQDDTEYSNSFTIHDLVKTNVNLSPKRYLNAIEVKDGRPIEDVVVKITRGIGKNVKDRESDQPTPFRYLKLQDIVNGEVSKELPSITHIDKKEERYVLQDNDVVIGKMKPFKTAVARIHENEKVLACENVFILRPNTNIILPLYLKLALESELGLSQLEANVQGTYNPILPISAFKEIQIPVPPIGEQQKIIDKYKVLNERAELYEQKARDIRDEISTLIEKGGDVSEKA